MKIAILPDFDAPDCFATKWQRALENIGVSVEFVDLFHPEFWKCISASDGFMWRHRHIPDNKIKALRLLGTIEYGMKIPVFPDIKTCWHYDDKIAQYYMLHTNCFPAVDSYVFWDKKRALDWCKSTSFPKVFKLASGAGSSNVVKVESAGEARQIIERAFDEGIFARSLPGMLLGGIRKKREKLKQLLRRFRRSVAYVVQNRYPPLPSDWWLPEKNVVYFQDFLEENTFDTRIVVVGKRAFGFRRFNRPNDFRASGSGRLDYDPSSIDPEFLKIAFAISERFSFQSMAYDFLYRKGVPVVIEMSYTFGNKAGRCPGHWDRQLNWINGQMEPQEAQVLDFVASIEQKR